MMKHIVFTGVLFLASAITGEAMAACSGTRVQALDTLLSGRMVCKSEALPPPSHWVWQEYHTAGGGANSLVDYKMGPPAPGNVDPTAPVGSWSVTNDNSASATVTYNYGPGQVYTYEVWDTLSNGSDYSFCTAGVEKVAGATLRAPSGSAISCGAP